MKPLKILILEDSLLTVKDIKATLLAAGHLPARSCRSVSEAIRAVDAEVFDIALIDIELTGGESGIEFAKQLNRKGEVPFIFLTSHEDDENFIAAKVTKPAAYLIKPFRARELSYQLELAYENFTKGDDVVVNQSQPYLFLPFRSGVKKIDKKKVVYLQSKKSSTFIFLEDQKVPEYFSVNIGYLEQFFEEDKYVKISRSAVINLDYMIEMFEGEVYLNFLDGITKLTVSSNSPFIRSLNVVRRPK